MLYDEPGYGAAGKKKKKGIVRAQTSESFIEKYDSRGQPTVVIQEFDPEVFKQLVEYIHTGSVTLQSRTLLGLMNAADHYGLEELKLASIEFLERAINTDTVCSLLASAEKYIQYKSTKILVQKMLEYVDRNAEVVLNQLAFSFLPQHVVRLVLRREELQACEETKFEASFKWALRYVNDNGDIDLKTAFEPFVSQIEFHKISVKILMQKIKPAQVVDDATILTALAYQADPTSVDPRKLNIRFRRASQTSTPEPGPIMSNLDHSPGAFRRVRSSGMVVKNSSTVTEECSSDSTDGNRGGSVPPLDLRSDVPSRVFEIRAESQASELSLSSAESINSLSSLPHSPLLGRSTSSSSYSNMSADTVDTTSRKPSSSSENYVTLSSTSVEV